MRDLAAFRAAVRGYRRVAGRTQQQLARSVGLHPDVLSHKLNNHDGAVLTTRDVIGIVTTLAGWGALVTRADAEALLESMAVPRQALPADAWTAAPLAGLRPAAGEPGRRSPGPMPEAGSDRVQDEPGPSQLRPAPLPAPATMLIGRERERSEVAAALAAARLVTLTGVGGTGKTRLAVQVASDVAGTFADGVAFADLAQVSDPALFASAVAAALGVSPSAAEIAEAWLTAAVRDRNLLLVLDNLEHLVQSTQLLARLLAAAPGLRILATSRIALRLHAEQVLRVPPLRLPRHQTAAGIGDSEAVRLFITRARAAGLAFAPDESELAAVGAICAALDGLPLAIELAAARVRLYTPQALQQLLQSRLAVLTGGPRDVPSRQQALRATLDWSYQLLPPPMRHLFACLGTFAGPFSAVSAAAVAVQPDPASTLQQLAELADHSLVEVTPAAEPRFRMLQIVREYALARLAETGERHEAQRRHLVHYLGMVADVGVGPIRPEVAAKLDLLQAAYPNIRAALEFACDHAGHDAGCLDDGLRLAAGVSIVWLMRGPLAEGVLLLRRLLVLDDAAGRAARPPSRAAAMLQACALACFTGQHQAAIPLGREGVALYEELGDDHGLAVAHRFLGEAAAGLGEFGRAAWHCEHAISTACRRGDLLDEAAARNVLGQVHRHLGDLERAVALLRQAIQQFDEGGDPAGTASARASLAEAQRDAGDITAARRNFAAALRSHDSHGDRRGVAYDFDGLAGLAFLDGDWRQALIYLGAAQEVRDRTGARLSSVEQADLDRITAPALAVLPLAEREQFFAQGRSQPLADLLATVTG